MKNLLLILLVSSTTFAADVAPAKPTKVPEKAKARELLSPSPALVNARAKAEALLVQYHQAKNARNWEQAEDIWYTLEDANCAVFALEHPALPARQPRKWAMQAR